MSEQQILRIPVPFEPDLAEMIGQERRQLLLPAVYRWIREGSPRLLVVYGESGSGRSFVLRGAVHALHQQGQGDTVFYQSLANTELNPDGLRQRKERWLVLDDLHCVLGQREWEEGLFDLFNQAPEQCWLISTDFLPNVRCRIPDLGSRLMSGLILPLCRWTEDEMLVFVQQAARQRGIVLKNIHLDYIIRRARRNPTALLKVLYCIDVLTLQWHSKVSFAVLHKAIQWSETMHNGSIGVCD